MLSQLDMRQHIVELPQMLVFLDRRPRASAPVTSVGVDG